MLHVCNVMCNGTSMTVEDKRCLCLTELTNDPYLVDMCCSGGTRRTKICSLLIDLFAFFSDEFCWAIGIRKLCVVCISIHLDLWKFRADWISEIFLTFPSRIQLLPRFSCSSYSLTDPERNCWRLKFENALSIPPITKKPWKFGKIFFEGLWHFFGNLPDIQLMQRLWQATETFIAACVFRLIKQM